MPRKKDLTGNTITLGEEPVDDGMSVASFPNVTELEAAKEYRHARLPKELIPFVEYSDKFFSPLRQQAITEKRKAEAERPRTLAEDLKAALTDPEGFQISPLMRKALCSFRPKTLADLQAMGFETTGMNPVVIEKYGALILAIIARHEEQ